MQSLKPEFVSSLVLQQKSYFRHKTTETDRSLFAKQYKLTSMQKQKGNCPSKMVFQSAWLGRLELIGETSNQHAAHCLLAVG